MCCLASKAVHPASGLLASLALKCDGSAKMAPASALRNEPPPRHADVIGRLGGSTSSHRVAAVRATCGVGWRLDGPIASALNGYLVEK